MPGRELWSFLAGGQLLHTASNTCVGATDASAGSIVALVACDEADPWELLANGQVKMGSLCLSQHGVAAGVENVAAKAAASATSSVDAGSHGASAAVDTKEESFWASKFDEAGPVALTVDLGTERHLQTLKIAWEFPAKAFSVSLSTDGDHWTESFATTVNMLRETTINLAGKRASKVRLAMQEAHPFLGMFQGHAVYGIRSVAVMAPRLAAILDQCTAAAQSGDARDKYFTVSVPEFDPAAAAALRHEAPALESAVASLSTALSQLSEKIPQLPMCLPRSAATAQAMRPESPLHSKLAHAEGATRLRASMMATVLGHDGGAEAAAIDSVDVRAIDQLLGAAKSAVVDVRSGLV